MKQICETNRNTYIVELTEAELLVLQESAVKDMIVTLEGELRDVVNNA